MISTNPSNKFFYLFHEMFFPSEKELRKSYISFHSASLKYDQYHYCHEKLIESLESCRSHNEINLNDRSITIISTYLDGFIITARTSADLAIIGLCNLYGLKKPVKSGSQLINDLEKDEQYKVLDSYNYWTGIRQKHFSDNFSWTRCLFRRSDVRSMRDKTVHNYSLDYSPVTDLMDNTKYYLSTGEYVDGEEERKVPISLELIPFILEVLNGVDHMLELIRDESYRKLRNIQKENTEANKAPTPLS